MNNIATKPLPLIQPYNKEIKPFIRWAGGKRHLLPELIKRIPQTPINRYYEPFLGGGAMFLALHDRINEAYLSDLNEELIVTWNMVKLFPEQLLSRLKQHENNHCNEYYYHIRKQLFRVPINRAARFIYLNKTCFNGLYRVNKRGIFNVPCGKSKTQIADRENLMQCSYALKNTKILCQNFNCLEAQKGDFVYFDPPYFAANDNGFTNYTAQGFNTRDHERLHDLAVKLHHKGVQIMLSHADSKFIRWLYKEPFFKIEELTVNHNMNRSKSREVIITTR